MSGNSGLAGDLYGPDLNQVGLLLDVTIQVSFENGLLGLKVLRLVFFER